MLRALGSHESLRKQFVNSVPGKNMDRDEWQHGRQQDSLQFDVSSDARKKDAHVPSCSLEQGSKLP